MGWLLGSGRCWLWDGPWAVGGVGYGMVPGQREALTVGWLLGSGRRWLWDGSWAAGGVGCGRRWLCTEWPRLLFDQE